MAEMPAGFIVSTVDLSKRELFAAMALTAIIPIPGHPESTYGDRVIDAINYADTLIAELSREKK